MGYKWRIILAFAAIYIIWGSTYLAIIFAIRDIPPLLMSGMRYFFAGVLLLGWCTMIKKESIPDITSLGKNALCGILMLFGGTGALAWAEQYISSGLAAILVTSVPFWFVLLDKKQWSFYFSNKIILAGLLIGFAGVALLISFGKASSNIAATHRINSSRPV
jgi:drug/metabolite transporter (DMT)-like permease